MNLDSLSYTLAQISYLVSNLSKKNYKPSVQEIFDVSITYAAVCLWCVGQWGGGFLTNTSSAIKIFVCVYAPPGARKYSISCSHPLECNYRWVRFLLAFSFAIFVCYTLWLKSIISSVICWRNYKLSLQEIFDLSITSADCAGGRSCLIPT